MIDKKPPLPAPSIESLSDEALVALVRTQEPSFDGAMLEDAEALLRWICEHTGIFDRAASAKPALRPQTGIDAFLEWASDAEEVEAALAQERTEQWSLLGHGEQTYLYWDRSALPQPRVVELDHEQRLGGLMSHDWRGARQVLLGLWARWAGEPDGDDCSCSLHRRR